MADAAIAAQLAVLERTTAYISPVNHLDTTAFARDVRPIENAYRRKTGPLTKSMADIETVIKRGERALALSADPDVTQAVRDIEFSERTMKLAADGVPEVKPRKRKGANAGGKPLPAVFKPSQIGALQRMPQSTFLSESKSQFAFTDDIKQSLRERDNSACMKMDDFKSYTAELVKWQNTEKLSRQHEATYAKKK